MKYIEEIIDKEYKKWKNGDKIVISSPTGSGKSTFVLKKLLPWAVDNGKKIVYLCNRKILKDQIIERKGAV